MSGPRTTAVSYIRQDLSIIKCYSICTCQREFFFRLSFHFTNNHWLSLYLRVQGARNLQTTTKKLANFCRNFSRNSIIQIVPEILRKNTFLFFYNPFDYTSLIVYDILVLSCLNIFKTFINSHYYKLQVKVLFTSKTNCAVVLRLK